MDGKSIDWFDGYREGVRARGQVAGVLVGMLMMVAAAGGYWLARFAHV